MNTKIRLLSFLFILVLTTLACGQIEFGIEEPSQPVSENTNVVIDTPVPEVQTDPEPDKGEVRDEGTREDYSQLWVEVEDYRTGLRFAIPCFWEANIPQPEQDPSGLGSFAVTNFSQDFISSLGPKRGGTVFEIGGLKFDIGYHTMTEFNLSPTSSLEEMAYALVNPDEEHGISSTTQTIINGTEALNVKSWSQFGEGQFYLMKMSDNFIVLFAPNDADHPDILAILNSMTMAPDAIQLPIQHPADPPEGMAAPCIGQNQLVDGSDEENSIPGTLDCNQVTDAEKLMWTICNVRDSIISRNTQPLPGYMGDTFKIGYWQSEGVDLTKDQAMAELKNNHIPPNTGDMTFTTERTQFPSLFGMPPEQIFPPDANIAEVVYSEGWGQNGQGAALLYFAENSVGDYYFYGMVIAQQHFDK